MSEASLQLSLAIQTEGNHSRFNSGYSLGQICGYNLCHGYFGQPSCVLTALADRMGVQRKCIIHTENTGSTKKKRSCCKSYGTATLCSIFIQYPHGYLRLLDDNADRVSNLPGPYLHKKLWTSNPASFRFADQCAQIFDYTALPGKMESHCAS